MIATLDREQLINRLGYLGLRRARLVLQERWAIEDYSAVAKLGTPVQALAAAARLAEVRAQLAAAISERDSIRNEIRQAGNR